MHPCDNVFGNFGFICKIKWKFYCILMVCELLNFGANVFFCYFLLQITEVRDFAGQQIEVKKFVDAESKEAAEKARAPPPSAVDAVLEQIKKKPKLSVLDKTKKDWGEFKEENKGLEEELDAYKKSSNQYLDKVSFLQRTDYREFERERDARLALQARRRTDMREDDL